MSGDRLAPFHPLPKGLYRDRRFGALSSSAALLLLNAHMLADDSETDGVLAEHQFQAAGLFSRIMPDAVLAAIGDLVDAGFLEDLRDGTYFVVDFRGLAHAEHELRRQEAQQRQREAAAERQRRRRSKLQEGAGHRDVTRDVTAMFVDIEEKRGEETLRGRPPQHSPRKPDDSVIGLPSPQNARARAREVAAGPQGLGVPGYDYDQSAKEA